MPKASSTKKGQPARHAPFVAQLAEEDQVQKFGRVSKPGKRAKKGLDDDEDENEQTVRRSFCFRGAACSLGNFAESLEVRTGLTLMLFLSVRMLTGRPRR